MGIKESAAPGCRPGNELTHSTGSSILRAPLRLRHARGTTALPRKAVRIGAGGGESYRRLGEHNAYRVFGSKYLRDGQGVRKPFERFWENQPFTTDDVKRAFEDLREEARAGRGGKR